MEKFQVGNFNQSLLNVKSGKGVKPFPTKHRKMELAQYILSVLRTNLMVVFSWGFRNPVAINNGLRFFVNGFKHQGWVEVVYDEGWDLFAIRLIKGGKLVKEIEQVYVDSLVSTIDTAVERTADYAADVEHWLEDVG